MSSGTTYFYPANNQFKQYSVSIDNNLLCIYRGDSVNAYKIWDLEDVPLREAKMAAAIWVSQRVSRSVEQLLVDWKVRLLTPYINPLWLDESYEEPPI